VSPADGKDTSAASDLQKEIHSLAFGVRFLAGALAVALGAFNIGVSLYLPIFHRVFNEALPGLTLPFPTGFIMDNCFNRTARSMRYSRVDCPQQQILSG
jgi:hypothetical protein